MSTRRLPMSALIVDETVSARASYSSARVREMAARLRDGDTFPPIVAYRDGAALIVAEGFYRVRAHKLAGRQHIVVEVREGDRRAAELCAACANLRHGTHRSNADKRRAVQRLTSDPEWARWSDREIGRRVGVDHKTVGRWRKRHPATRLRRCEGQVVEFAAPAPRATEPRHASAVRAVQREVDALPDGPAKARAAMLLGLLTEAIEEAAGERQEVTA